jgi:hypothetical protein
MSPRSSLTDDQRARAAVEAAERVRAALAGNDVHAGADRL